MTVNIISSGKIIAVGLVLVAALSLPAQAQVKSATNPTTPDVSEVQERAISYGSTRSNKKMGDSIAAPAGETGEIGELKDINSNGVQPEIDTLRSIVEPKASPAGCVTVDGAVDANCDGVGDAPAQRRKNETGYSSARDILNIGK